MGGNKNSTFSHLQPTDSWSSDTRNGPLFLHSNLSQTAGFHSECPTDTACVDVALCTFWRFGWFFLLITVLFSALLSYLDVCNHRDTTSSTGMEEGGNGNNRWKWEGNGNKTRVNLRVGMGMKINHWIGMGGNGNTDCVPAHLYFHVE